MKRKVSVLLIAIVSLLVNSVNTIAAKWYVDNAVSASGKGRSWHKAFRQFSDIMWSDVHAGDIIYISGGPSGGSKTYTDSWSINNFHGSQDKPIIIGVDSSDPKHNGIVMFDYDAKGDTAKADGLSFLNNSFVTMTGNVKGQNHIVFKNLRNIINRMTAHCIAGSNNSGIIFDHIDIVNCNNGISVSFKGKGNEIRFSNFTQIRGDAAISVRDDGKDWDEIKIHDSTVETLVNNTPPPGQKSYGGPDGIQCAGGMSAYRNNLRVSRTKVYTSTQHPDMFQLQGNYLKIYDNEFTNIGDSGIDYDCYANRTPHDVWIYNNLFHIVTIIDAYPEYFRLYISMDRPFNSITNFKILNNTFADNTGRDQTGFITVRFNGFRNNNPIGSGNEIKNNIFYNCSNGSQYPNILIDKSTGFTDASFSFDANIYYHNSKPPYISYNGKSYPASDWVAAREPHGKTSAPAFVKYSSNSSDNNFHLAQADKVAKHAGISLSTYFVDDKDGKKRPKDSGWSIGAWE